MTSLATIAILYYPMYYFRNNSYYIVTIIKSKTYPRRPKRLRGFLSAYLFNDSLIHLVHRLAEHRDILFVFAPAQISLYNIPAMCYNNYI